MKHEDYTVGWICALPTEMAAALAMLDEPHATLPTGPKDDNNYSFGRMGHHNVVMACLPSGVTGTISAAKVATQMLSTFTGLKFGLMVGIGGGVPTQKHDIRLGDVVVSRPTGTFGGVIQYDFGKTIQDGKFILTGSLNKPPMVMLAALAKLEAKHKMESHKVAKNVFEMTVNHPEMAKEYMSPDKNNDLLYNAAYDHPEEHETCSSCDAAKLVTREPRPSDDPVIYYGLIASGDQVMRHGGTRDRLRQELDVLCFEMEAAGLMDSFPCLVIRGICDYADSHKNKQWQPYAAATASAYAKELLSIMPAKPAAGLATAADGRDIRSEEEANACLTAIFLTDPQDDRDKLIHIKGSRVDGTCEWIKTNELYNAWLNFHSQLLWLSGGPGKGKTMLSIFLAEELERFVEESQAALFIQYFCDNRDEKRNTAVAILRGLIWQILKHCPKLSNHILPSLNNRDASQLNTSFESLWRIFETMVSDPILGTVYCVLDGLDECDEMSLEVFLKKLKALFSIKSRVAQTCRLKLITVSRELPDFIPEILSSFPRLRLDPDADSEVNSDIHRFIEVKVDELSQYRRYSESLQAHVKEAFLDRAQGTFLWVGIVASELKKYRATETERALKLFPSELEGLYARMLLQIDVSQLDTAVKILRWVVMAVRPLTLSELSEAIGTTAVASAGFSCEEVMRDQVLSCGYFLTIKEDEVGLIHQSAKDYLLCQTPDSNPQLEYFRVDEEATNSEMARKCLNYIQAGAFADGDIDLRRGCDSEGNSNSEATNTRLKAFPLVSYAALHWPEHARALPTSEDIFDLSLPFYHKDSTTRKAWLESYFDSATAYRSLPNPFPLLHLASYLGLVELVKKLLSKRRGWMKSLKRHIHVNPKDGQGHTPLHWAAAQGA
jgi:ankyrin repeat domain-containing protein 50